VPSMKKTGSIRRRKAGKSVTAYPPIRGKYKKKDGSIRVERGDAWPSPPPKEEKNKDVRR